MPTYGILFDQLSPSKIWNFDTPTNNCAIKAIIKPQNSSDSI